MRINFSKVILPFCFTSNNVSWNVPPIAPPLSCLFNRSSKVKSTIWEVVGEVGTMTKISCQQNAPVSWQMAYVIGRWHTWLGGFQSNCPALTTTLIYKAKRRTKVNTVPWTSLYLFQFSWRCKHFSGRLSKPSSLQSSFQQNDCGTGQSAVVHLHCDCPCEWLLYLLPRCCPTSYYYFSLLCVLSSRYCEPKRPVPFFSTADLCSLVVCLLEWVGPGMLLCSDWSESVHSLRRGYTPLYCFFPSCIISSKREKMCLDMG